MRMRLWSSLLGFALSGLGSSGCDSITSGQLSDETGPPKLLRILVQDELPGISNPGAPGRGLATDLLDVGMPASCNETNPCPFNMSVGGVLPPPCNIPMGMTMGTCTDPLAAGPVEIGVPPGTPGTYGGIQIRLNFSKLLDGSVEVPVSNPAPGDNPFTLASAVLELSGPAGVVDTVQYYDPSGPPITTSDPVLFVPFGPALVMKPRAPLSPNTPYRIKLDPTKVTDRNRQGTAADKSGRALGNPYQVMFFTEDLTVLAVRPDVTQPSATIKPDDVIQFSFNAGIDESSVQVALMNDSGPVAAQAFSDRGTDPTMCASGLNDRRLDVVAGSGGTQQDMPEGNYTLMLSGIQDDGLGRSTPFTATYSFTVQGPKDPMDPSSFTAGMFVLPQSCL